ncbi:hypothetical protein M422DRAFT_248004 [Sphaerobolus stellatus SS14]|nr:hypothetical protein M422DRAFT_248004 [Sphaerobolus stellatus SS14]
MSLSPHVIGRSGLGGLLAYFYYTRYPVQQPRLQTPPLPLSTAPTLKARLTVRRTFDPPLNPICPPSEATRLPILEPTPR